MTKLALPLSILAAATLVACSSNPSPAPSTISSAAPIVPQQVAYRPGTGVVQNVVLTPGPISAVGGGTTPSSSSGRLVRLAIKMDAGGDIQYVDTDSSQFTKGTRVELTPDHLIRTL